MKKKLIALLSVMAVASSFCVGVFAADGVKDIVAQINYSLKMKVDNVDWTPTEEDGTAIRPITYNGRTYLPVRALAEKLGISIDWDGETQTVLIGGTSEVGDTKTQDKTEWLEIGSEKISSVDRGNFTRIPELLPNGNGNYKYGLTTLIEGKKYNGTYQQFTGLGDYSKFKTGIYCSGSNIKVKVYDAQTDEVLKLVEVKDGKAEDITVDIDGHSSIIIRWSAEKSIDTVVFGDFCVAE